MIFKDLPDGALFKFFEGGSLLTKSGPRTYEAPQWGQTHMTADPEQEVLPMDKNLPAANGDATSSIA